MSLTQIQLNVLSTQQFSQSTIEFGCECVVDQCDIINVYNIFWIEKGEAVINIDFTQYTITENTFFFLHPGQMFSVESEDKLTGIRLAFSEDFYCPKTNNGEIGCNGLLFNNLVGSPKLKIEKEEVGRFNILLKNIIDGLNKDITAKPELIESYLRILLIECTEYKKNEIVGVIDAIEESDKVIKKFNQLVEENYTNWHNISPYAEKFAISSKSLTKKLGKLGVSPSKVIQERLIVQAKRLLYFTSKQIKEIGNEIGFDDPAHFSTFFKNNTGIYPADFRKNMAL